MLSGGSSEAEVLPGFVAIHGAATEAYLGRLPHGWFQGLPECVPDDRPNERFGDARAMHHTQGPDLVHATWSSDEWCGEDDVPVLPCSQAEAAAFVGREDRPDWCSFV